jgi:hypothetical protein
MNERSPVRVVISQSMLFPWVGMLEQVRLADDYVYYDDVQFSKGSFVNRVQIKAPEGMKWMTVPLPKLRLGQRIDEVQVPPSAEWRDQHFSLLRRSLSEAPFFSDAMGLVESVYAADYASIGALSRASLMSLVDYFGLGQTTRFTHVADLGIPGTSSDRVLEIVRALGGTDYVTGHGALRYLDHERFERSLIHVRYMNYRRLPYPQLHGDFVPFVSALDLVANCGRDGVRYIASETTDWKEFSNESA